MVRYLALISFTEQGVKNMGATIQRAETFEKMAQKAGAAVKGLYWTVGAYDGALLLEAPDEPTAAALLAKLAASGNVRTQTLRAFDRTEMQAVAAKM
jgi:uncharacterized protein with GYD domain